MANVGSAYVTLMPSMRGFATKVNKEFGSAGKSGGASFSKGFDVGGGSAKGFSGKMAGLAGAIGGVASTIADTALSSISSLGGEMIAASDSAQKFASTLEFSGLDSSTIDALTKSTQEYADRTVYDLTDIRNVTAQLASNGVKDYAQLAEAAGNLNAVAGGNADTFKSVGMVMTQTAGQGKLVTENWNQLVDAIPGVSGPLEQAMRDAGAFEGNFRDAMANGEISADEFFDAVQKLGMTDIAKEAATSTATIEGAVGNLSASVVSIGSTVIDAVKPYITGAMTEIANGLNSFSGLLSEALDPASELGQKVQSGLSAVIPIIASVAGAAGSLKVFSTVSGWVTKAGSALSGITSTVSLLGGNFAQLVSKAGLLKAIPTFFAGMVSPVTLVVAAIGALIAIFATLYATNDEFRNMANLAFQQIGSAIQSLMPTLQQLGSAFMSMISSLAPVFAQLAASIIPLITQIVSMVVPIINQIFQLIITMMPTILSVVTTVITTISGVIQAVLPLIQSIITTAMNVINAVISTVLALIQGNWSGVWNGIQSVASAIWSGIGSIISAAINAVSGIISSVLSGISGIWNGMWSSISSFFGSIWSGIQSAAQSGINGVLNTISGIKDRILGFFSGAGSWLADAGRSIVNGLAEGIKGAVGAATGAISSVLDAVSSFLPHSPAKTGPFSGRGWTLYSGQAITSALADGIAGKTRVATSAALGMVSSVQAALNGSSVAINSTLAMGSYPSSDRSGSSETSQIIQWLATNLPAIIEQYTPVMGESDFDRRARKAVKYA